MPELKHIIDQLDALKRGQDKIYKAIAGDPLTGEMGMQAHLRLHDKEIAELKAKKMNWKEAAKFGGAGMGAGTAIGATISKGFLAKIGAIIGAIFIILIIVFAQYG